MSHVCKCFLGVCSKFCGHARMWVGARCADFCMSSGCVMDMCRVQRAPLGCSPLRARWTAKYWGFFFFLSSSFITQSVSSSPHPPTVVCPPFRGRAKAWCALIPHAVGRAGKVLVQCSLLVLTAVTHLVAAVRWQALKAHLTGDWHPPPPPR